MANNFAGDSRFVAQWKFEVANVNADALGIQADFSNYNLTANSGWHKEGSYSIFCNPGMMWLPDASLSTAFPLKGTNTHRLMTYCAWIKPTALSGTQWLWCKYCSSFNPGHNTGLVLSGTHLLFSDGVPYNGGEPGTSYDTGITLVNNHEYHIASVLDATNNTIHVRVYDVTAGTTTNYDHAIGTISIGTNSGDFTLGRDGSYNSRWFYGYMDEVVIANALLSDAEIDAIRNGTYSLLSDMWFTASLAAISGADNPSLAMLASRRPLIQASGVVEELQQGDRLNLNNIPTTPTNYPVGDLWVDNSETQNILRMVGASGNGLMSGAIDPGHKHSKLWASDGSAQAVFVDINAHVGIGCNPLSTLTLPGNGQVTINTAPGSDNAGLFLSGGGAWDSTRAACLDFYGVNHATLPGVIRLSAGMVGPGYTTGAIQLMANGWQVATVLASPWGLKIWKAYDGLGSFFDYATGYLGIGVTPAAKLAIHTSRTYGGAGLDYFNSTIMLTGMADEYPRFELHSYGGTLTYQAPDLRFYRARGSEASPASTADGDILGGIHCYAFNGTLVNFCLPASMELVQQGATLSTGNPGVILFNTSDGTVSYALERMRIDHLGQVGIGCTPDGSALLQVAGVIGCTRIFANSTDTIQQIFYKSNAPTDQKYWYWEVGDGTLGLRMPSDSWASNNYIFIFGRSGNTPLYCGYYCNMCIGTGAVFGTNAAMVLGIATGTAPTTGPADSIQIYSTDISAGQCCLAVFQEYAPYAGAGVASTHKIPVKWNGITYYILATTVA